MRTLASTLVLVSWLFSTAAAQTGAEPANCSDGEDLAPAATLAWKEVPNDESLGETRGPLHLVATNPGATPVDLEIAVLVDSGGPETTAKSLAIRGLAPRETREVALDLRRLRPKGRAQRFSGQVLARARVLTPGACDRGACERTPGDDAGDDAEPRAGDVNTDGRDDVIVGTLSSPAIYFHREKGKFLVYGEEVLVGRFQGGSLRGAPTTEPDEALLRVTDSGNGLPNDRRFASEDEIGTLDDEDPEGPRATAALEPVIDIPSNAYRFCMKWQIGVDDAGRLITTPEGVKVTEDYWHGDPDYSGTGFSPFQEEASTTPSVTENMIVTARGVAIRIARGDWKQSLDTDPATGCVTVTPPPGNGPFEVTARFEHKDKLGNLVRVKNSVGNVMALKTFIAMFPGTTAVVALGGYGPRATLAATTGFLMYRTAFGNVGKTIDVRESKICASKGGAESSAHFDFDDIAEGLAHVRIHMPADGCSQQDHRRLKFLVGHEIGHAWQLLAMGIEKVEPGIDLSFEDDPPTENVCIVNAKGYTLGSVEWSSIGAREGLAHFYATEVFNKHSSGNAVFTWFGRAKGEDVERNDPHEKGGRLFKTCDGTYSRYGLGTNLDWLRFYWDIHTPFRQERKFTMVDISRIYEAAVRSEDIDRTSYFHEMSKAAKELAIDKGYDDYLKSGMFGFYGCFNGVATSSTAGNIPCDEPFGYPNCEFANPEDGAGLAGCPCQDVIPSSNTSTLATDGYYSDGPGSYLAHGFGGLGQSCTDEQIGLPTRSVCGRQPSEQGSYVPMCMICEEDTMWGCPCTNDDSCNALGKDDVTLACIGAPGPDGFAGNAPGTCLPAPDTELRRAMLVDDSWFCLDNCGAKEAAGAGPQACLFDQFPGSPQAHGECTNLFCSEPVGSCELEGLTCGAEGSCGAECLTNVDCAPLGFPEFYECDFASGGNGKCVPPGCGSAKVFDESYCALYR